MLDEPSNHIDLKSIKTVEAAIMGFDGALLAASHDAEFLANIGITCRLELPSAVNQSGDCRCLPTRDYLDAETVALAKN